MKAVIYRRVSTKDQEEEGTSLPTRLETCFNYCRDKSYNVPCRISEACSGLTLDSRRLNELPELVRAGNIGLVVAYYPCFQQLSRAR